MEKLPVSVEKILNELYFKPNNPASFGGVTKLYRAARQRNKKINLSQVKHWLAKKDTYSLFKPIRYRFKRNKTIVYGINDQWQIDLADMTGFAKYNEGYRYILTIIVVFSKKAYAIPVKTKKGEEITFAFDSVFENEKVFPPRVVQSDEGREFTNKTFQGYLKKKNIHFFSSKSELKAAIVERFIRTMKERLFRYFQYSQNYAYLQVLPEIINAYNNSFHRSIGMSPNSVNLFNEMDVWQRLYDSPPSPIRKVHFIKVGDHVRIVESRRLYRKGYEGGWSQEIFLVSQIIKRNPIVYKLKDLKGEEIIGTFYSQELQVVDVSVDKFYQISSILKERGRGKKKQFLVRWVGYDPSFDSWISAKDIQLSSFIS